MSFFEPLEQPPPEEEHRAPAWLGPPDNVLGAAVPLRLLLARTDDVAIAITDATAFPNGVELNVALRLRRLSPAARRALMRGGPFHYPSFPGDEPDGGIPPELLRLGVQFADGRKATTLGPRHQHFEREPDGPVLMQRGGGGGDRSWNMHVWLWPLPPPGALAFVVEWPLAGIAETRVEIDAGVMIEAAAQAETLWPETGGGGSGGNNWTSVMSVAQERPDDPPKE
jgi:hypothetical protein